MRNHIISVCNRGGYCLLRTESPSCNPYENKGGVQV